MVSKQADFLSKPRHAGQNAQKLSVLTKPGSIMASHSPRKKLHRWRWWKTSCQGRTKKKMAKTLPGYSGGRLPERGRGGGRRRRGGRNKCEMKLHRKWLWASHSSGTRHGLAQRASVGSCQQAPCGAVGLVLPDLCWHASSGRTMAHTNAALLAAQEERQAETHQDG